MIKFIIFDLDGVLINTKKIHFDSLNEAISLFDKENIISWDDHINKYDGLKTKQKLEILTTEKGLLPSLYKDIWTKKQEITLKYFKNIKPNLNISDLLINLLNEGYKIACCSNSIKKSVLTVLSRLEIIEYFDIILSNEDVKNGKPHPEIYWKAISSIGCLPEETLIIEDSPYGLQAAFRSRSNILRVLDTSEVTYLNIKNKIRKFKFFNFKFII